MALVKWRPRESSLFDIRNEISRMFDSFFLDFPWRSEAEAGSWAPRVDIAETNGELVVAAELPGLTRSDVSIRIENNVLTLKGEKKQEEEKKGTNYHRIERSYGAFNRSFSLPSTVDTNKVKAAFKDGVLTITLPKTEEAKGKEIPIEVE